MAIKVDKDGNKTVVENNQEEQKSPDNILSDAQKNVKILTVEEYNKLKPEEQALYIPYQPSMSDKAIAIMVRQANAQLKALSKMMPAFENMKLVPTPLPSEKLKELLDSIEKMTSLLDPIEKLSNVKIIGTLVKPLVNLINAIFSVIGQIFYFIFALARGQNFFMDTVTGTYDQIDWQGINDSFVDFNKQRSASVENVDIDWDSIPGKTQYNDIKKFKDDLDKVTNMTTIVDAAIKTQKKVSDLTLKQHTWDFYYKNIQNIFGLLGVDMSLLNRPTETEMKNFEKLFPDPKKLVEDMTGGLNKMVEKRYISIANNDVLTELEKQADKT